ncbi:MAG: hypothetical protein EHM93_06905 [Bacteroidales bacterium]|nr:MAG: hypothetical protein EHM93_06905 [Bacteroidales bacterium]
MGLQRILAEELKSSTSINNINNLIREVDSTYKPNSSEKKYYLDKGSMEVYENKPISFSKKEWAYYIIDFNEIVEIKGLKKELTELDNSCSLSITINYSAQIQQNHQKDLIKLLVTEPRFENALNNRIVRWISTFASNEPQFVKRFYSLQTKLKNYLEDEARKLGLSLDLAIEVREEKVSKTLRGQVDVKVNDFHNRIPLSYELEVNVLENKKVEGMQTLMNTIKLDEKVKEIIKKSINSKSTIDLHYFHFNLHTGLREFLIRELDIDLDRDGLKPEFLTLESQLRNVPPERSQLIHNVSCITKNSYGIDIEHHLILTLKNLGDFYNSGIKDINEWVKDELNRITQDCIFEKDFTELALNFNSDYIKLEMAKSLTKKGYEIRQLITIPKLEGIIPDHFDFEVGNDIEFPTHKEDVRIKLNIIASGKIEDPKKIARLINPKTTRDGIISKMKETVVNTVRQFIHQVDPKRFYLNFNFPENGKGDSLADELRKKILSKLNEEFGTKEVDIILKQLETDLVRSFKTLFGVNHTINIEIYQLQAKFDAQFMVVSVHEDSYDLFKAKCDAYKSKDILILLEDISRFVKHNVELHLNKIHELNEENINTDEFFRHLVVLLNATRNIVAEAFGLDIKIAPWLRRHPSITDEIQQKKNLFDKERVINDMIKIKEFEEEKLSNMINFQKKELDMKYNDSEMEKYINKRIDEINETLTKTSGKNIREKLKLPEITEILSSVTKNIEIDFDHNEDPNTNE